MTSLDQVFAELVRRVVRDELAVARPSADKSLISVAQAARRLGLSQSFVRAAINDGHLPIERFGRAVRIHPTDVDALATKPKTGDELTAHAERVLGIVKGGRP